jgi:ribulose-5-phosphate 4-epimerase/fuculose-1-phosphate aldolase
LERASGRVSALPREEAAVHFTPTAEKLMPDLSPREELTCLARALCRRGYTDHVSGHLVYDQGDGTMLCNPRLLRWNEFRPDQVVRVDMTGRVVEGDWPPPGGIPLHLLLHAQRPEMTWTMHHHTTYGTIWADMGEVPPAMDQTSAMGGTDAILIDEYDGGFEDNDAGARKVVDALGQAKTALLRGHGVLLLTRSARAMYARGATLELRCHRAWAIKAAGGQLRSPVPDAWVERLRMDDGERYPGYWEAAVREELSEDPHLLGSDHLSSTH